MPLIDFNTTNASLSPSNKREYFINGGGVNNRNTNKNLTRGKVQVK